MVRTVHHGLVLLCTCLLQLGESLVLSSADNKPKWASKSRSHGDHSKSSQHDRSRREDRIVKATAEDVAASAQKVVEMIKKPKSLERTHVDAHAKLKEDMSTDLVSLWRGVDFPADRFCMSSMSLPEELAAARPKHNVHVFGLQSTGTSLLRAMMYFNFGNKFNYYYDPDTEDADAHSQGLWCHANLKEQWAKEPKKIQAFMQDNVTAIVLVRNPYSWLAAMKNDTKASRLAHDCATGDDWLTQECVHETPAGLHSSVPRSVYGSLAAVWNHWYDGFNRSTEFGFADKLVLNYETLVKDPFTAMQTIANFFKIAKPERGWTIPYETMVDAQSIAADEERAHNLAQTFSNMQMMQACKRLDTDLQVAYGYEDMDCASFTAVPAEAQRKPENAREGTASIQTRQEAQFDKRSADEILKEQEEAVSLPRHDWSSSNSPDGRESRIIYMNGPHGGSGAPKPEDADFNFVMKKKKTMKKNEHGKKPVKRIP